MNFVVDDRFRTRFRTLRPSSPDPPRAPRGPKEPQGPSLGPLRGFLWTLDPWFNYFPNVQDPTPGHALCTIDYFSNGRQSYEYGLVLHLRKILVAFMSMVSSKAWL